MNQQTIVLGLFIALGAVTVTALSTITTQARAQVMGPLQKQENEPKTIRSTLQVTNATYDSTGAIHSNRSSIMMKGDEDDD